MGLFTVYITKYLQIRSFVSSVDESSSLGGGSLNQVSGLGIGWLALPSADGGSNANKAIQVMGSLSFFENYIMPKIFLPDSWLLNIRMKIKK